MAKAKDDLTATAEVEIATPDQLYVVEEKSGETEQPQMLSVGPGMANLPKPEPSPVVEVKGDSDWSPLPGSKCLDCQNYDNANCSVLRVHIALDAETARFVPDCHDFKPEETKE